MLCMQHMTRPEDHCITLAVVESQVCITQVLTGKALGILAEGPFCFVLVQLFGKDFSFLLLNTPDRLKGIKWKQYYSTQPHSKACSLAEPSSPVPLTGHKSGWAIQPCPTYRTQIWLSHPALSHLQDTNLAEPSSPVPLTGHKIWLSHPDLSQLQFGIYVVQTNARPFWHIHTHTLHPQQLQLTRPAGPLTKENHCMYCVHNFPPHRSQSVL